ncbi:MAG: adenosylcobinamide amidohydrolase [Eubacterium sp.]|nr:adenosylcobinamide amidohydrolase [Eubacterium sp.]MDD7209322.1 adenosylcobinamide amidohydrolase [Lachnospiraceae bacterium]MDY5498140.1 adenosylcobinamide amidohydrolase [Anaerobutyricum sp.]
MKIYEFSNGDTVHKYKKSIVICFKGKRSVLSTGPNNGGYRTDLKAVFNNDGNPGSGMAISLRADTYREHMEIISRDDLGIDPEDSTGIMTAASMDNAAISSLSYENFSVTAITTAGVRSNGGRIGDPASWHEVSESSFENTPPVGTINILLYINAHLEKEALASALVSCAEAKAAAMQELMIPSRYSSGLATGTGTDGVIVVSDDEADITLSNAGKHSKLGELIGRTVISSIKEALRLQQGITPKSQHDILCRMDRFGITQDALWECFHRKNASYSRAEFTDVLDHIKKEDRLVTYSSLYAHLLDQQSWKLLSPCECSEAAEALLALAGLHPDKIEDSDSLTDWYLTGLVNKISAEISENQRSFSS